MGWSGRPVVRPAAPLRRGGDAAPTDPNDRDAARSAPGRQLGRSRRRPTSQLRPLPLRAHWRSPPSSAVAIGWLTAALLGWAPRAPVTAAARRRRGAGAAWR